MTAEAQMEAEVLAEAELAQKREKLKGLLKYEKSEEYSELEAYCKKMEDEALVEVQEELENRESIDIEYSLVSERKIYIEVLRDYVDKITNPEFKKYIEDRIEAHISFCENRAGEDTPIYSLLDLKKFVRQEYHNLHFYLEFCIESYKEEKEQDEDNSAY
jgi:hypothetical protein